MELLIEGVLLFLWIKQNTPGLLIEGAIIRSDIQIKYWQDRLVHTNSISQYSIYIITMYKETPPYKSYV